MTSLVSPIKQQSADAGVGLAIDGAGARITLAHPARRNALDTAAWRALAAACRRIAADTTIRVVILSGEGEHFCAGADIRELAEHIEDAAWMGHNQSEIGAALDAWAALPQPTIAQVRGSCFGGGMALALSSDFVYAADTARFALTPAKLGLSYRLVDCLRVKEVVGTRRARELLLAARELDAATASDWGIVNAMATLATLETLVEQQLQALLQLSSVSQRAIKHNLLKIRDGVTADDADTRRLFAEAFQQADFRVAAAAFADKARPKDRPS